MKEIDKLKKAVSNIASKGINAYNGYKQALCEQVDMMDAVNRIASLSNYDYALSISETIKKICYCRTSPNYETFMSLSKMAIMMLQSGTLPYDVMILFDTMLYKEKRGNTP